MFWYGEAFCDATYHTARFASSSDTLSIIKSRVSVLFCGYMVDGEPSLPED